MVEIQLYSCPGLQGEWPSGAGAGPGVSNRLLGTLSDALHGHGGMQMERGERRQALLDDNSHDPIAQQLPRLRHRLVVTGHEHHRYPEMPRDRGVDAELAS